LPGRALFYSAGGNIMRFDIAKLLGVLLAVEVITLGAMAFNHVGVEWLLAVGFPFSTMIICQALVDFRHK
jgi:hypothetical protein